jgi:FixJ family two-component response regulator
VGNAGSVAIIDDDDELRLSLGRLMRAYGVEARLFESADAFLASDQFPFDCVIADVHMPGTDGITMIEQLRQRGDEVPVIVVSALDPDRTRELAIASGAYAFYSKPVDSAALLALIVHLANARSGSQL